MNCFEEREKVENKIKALKKRNYKRSLKLTLGMLDDPVMSKNSILLEEYFDRLLELDKICEEEGKKHPEWIKPRQSLKTFQ